MQIHVRKLVLALVSVFAITIIVYLNSLSNSLIWDDAVFIERNPFVTNCSNLKTALNPVYLAKVLPVPMGARPLVNISILLDTCAGGGAMNMRLTNLILHATNAVLVLMAAYVLTGALAPAFLAGLLFGLHPASAEAVAIVTFRSQLLCVFFYLSALLTGLVYVRHKNPAFLAGSILAFLAAMLSNEAGITFPLVFAVLFLTVERAGGWSPPAADDSSGNRKALILHLSICAAVATAYLWFRLPRGGYDLPGTAPFGPAQALEFLYPRALMPKDPAPVKFEMLSKPPWGGIYVDWKLRLFTMTNIAGGYLRDLLLPLWLNGDYNPPVIRTFTGALPGFATASLAGLAAFASRRKAPLAAFGILFVLAALLPVMNIVPIYNIKADRYLYLPLAGFALIAAAVAAFALGGTAMRCPPVGKFPWRGSRDRKAGKAVFAGLILYIMALGALTAARNPVFRNDFVFFSSITSAGTGTIPRAELNMAAAYFMRGDATQARVHIAKALAEQNNYQVRLCWAELELFLGSLDKAEELLGAVLLESPENRKALHLKKAAAWLKAKRATKKNRKPAAESRQQTR